jgi:cell division protein FtsI (penicillin-binding protein 3)
VRQRLQTAFIAWRFYFLIIFILFIVVGLSVRLFDLSVIKQHFLQTQGDSRALRIENTPPFRGIIADRDGYPLAISTTVYSVWINPKEFTINPQNVQTLSRLLGVKKSSIQSQVQLYKNKNREFMYLKRDVSPEIAGRIKALNIPGLYQNQDYKRFYPEGEISAHLIGFTNVDDQGQEGMELTYNPLLSGIPGKKIVLKDRLGRSIKSIQEIQQQKPGHDLKLSINRRIQYIAYRELLNGVKENMAPSGSVVVLDVKTGEILAMVNQPSFNPNNRSSAKSDALRNRAITDVFEPGSTIKAFSITAALESGRFNANTVIDTYPGWIVVGGHTVRDEHRKGPMTLTEILQYSSNVGTTKIILTLPPDTLWKMFHRMGFGEETGVRFPGERSGSLLKREKWPPFALATLSWGYGLSVTTLQLAHAYATLANDGVKVPLTLLKVDQAPEGEQVIDPKVSREMLHILESVVDAKGGTARAAGIPGYRIAGKTGTSRILGPHGYDKHRHNSIFVGVAPVSNPRILIAVVIHDPQGKKYYGGDVSAPVFRGIMEGALRIMNIPPDNASS